MSELDSSPRDQRPDPPPAGPAPRAEVPAPGAGAADGRGDRGAGVQQDSGNRSFGADFLASRSSDDQSPTGSAKESSEPFSARPDGPAGKAGGRGGGGGRVGGGRTGCGGGGGGGAAAGGPADRGGGDMPAGYVGDTPGAGTPPEGNAPPRIESPERGRAPAAAPGTAVDFANAYLAGPREGDVAPAVQPATTANVQLDFAMPVEAPGEGGGGSGGDAKGDRGAQARSNRERGDRAAADLKAQFESKGHGMRSEVVVRSGRDGSRVDLAPDPKAAQTIGKTVESKSLDLDNYRTPDGRLDVAKLTETVEKNTRQVLKHESALREGPKADLPTKETLVYTLQHAKPGEAQQFLRVMRDTVKAEKVVGGVLLNDNGTLRTASGHVLRQAQPESRKPTPEARKPTPEAPAPPRAEAVPSRGEPRAPVVAGAERLPRGGVEGLGTWLNQTLARLATEREGSRMRERLESLRPSIDAARRAGEYVALSVTIERPRVPDLGAGIVTTPDQLPRFIGISMATGRTADEAAHPPMTFEEGRPSTGTGRGEYPPGPGSARRWETRQVILDPTRP